MKYLISVLLGAMSYGILSTIVVKAYGEGYVIGEVVGSQAVDRVPALLGACVLYPSAQPEEQYIR